MEKIKELEIEANAKKEQEEYRKLRDLNQEKMVLERENIVILE